MGQFQPEFTAYFGYYNKHRIQIVFSTALVNTRPNYFHVTVKSSDAAEPELCIQEGLTEQVYHIEKQNGNISIPKCSVLSFIYLQLFCPDVRRHANAQTVGLIRHDSDPVQPVFADFGDGAHRTV